MVFEELRDGQPGVRREGDPIPEEAVKFLWRQRQRLADAGGAVHGFASGDLDLAQLVARAEALRGGLVKQLARVEPRTLEGTHYLIEALKQANGGSHDVAVALNGNGWPVAALSFERRPGWIVVGLLGSARVLPGAGTGLEVELAIIAAGEQRGVVTDDISRSNEAGDMDEVDPVAIRVLEEVAGR